MPSAKEWANPWGVSMVSSLGLREKKRSVLRAREGRRGIGPVWLKREEMDKVLILEGSSIWSFSWDECCCLCWLVVSKHGDGDENSNEDLLVIVKPVGRRCC